MESLYKNYVKFQVVDVNGYHEAHRKEGWEILEFIKEKNEFSNCYVQTYGNDSIPVPSSGSNYSYKFLLGQRLMQEILYGGQAKSTGSNPGTNSTP